MFPCGFDLVYLCYNHVTYMMTDMHASCTLPLPYSGLILRGENFEVFMDFALSSKI